MKMFAILIAVLYGIVSGTIINVSPDSTIATVQGGLNAAASGDTVRLVGGPRRYTITNPLTINRQVTLLSVNHDTIYGTNIYTIVPGTNVIGIKLINLEFIANGTSEYTYLLKATNCDSFYVYNCGFRSNGDPMRARGISLRTNDSTIVNHKSIFRKCYFKKIMAGGAEYLDRIHNINNVIIDSCTFDSSSIFIGSNYRITYNKFKYFIFENSFSGDNWIFANNIMIAGNFNSELFTGDVGYGGHSRNCTIDNNIFYGGTHVTLMIDNLDSSTVSNNILVGAASIPTPIYSHCDPTYYVSKAVTFMNNLIQGNATGFSFFQNRSNIPDKMTYTKNIVFGGNKIDNALATNCRIDSSVFSATPLISPPMTVIDIAVNNSILTTVIDTVFHPYWANGSPSVQMRAGPFKYLLNRTKPADNFTINSAIIYDSIASNYRSYESWFTGGDTGNIYNYISANKSTWSLADSTKGVCAAYSGYRTLDGLTSNTKYYYRSTFVGIGSAAGLTYTNSIDSFTTLSTPQTGHSYYVSTSGNNSNNGSINNPWRDVSFATCGGTYHCPCTTTNAHRLSAGDTLYIRAGTYYEHQINISDSGTANNPIVIRNYPGESVFLDGEYVRSVFELGTYNTTANIIIKGLNIRRGQVAGIWVGSSISCRNVIIDSCDIRDIMINDNTACVYVGYAADSITIKNCYLNLGHPDTTRGAGIELFRGGNNHVIDHNEITGSFKGIYYKHGNNPSTRKFIVKNNYIHDIASSHDQSSAIAISTDNAYIYNNLIVNCYLPVWFYPGEATDSTGVGAFYGTIRNNTIVNNNRTSRDASISLNSYELYTTRGTRFANVKKNVVLGDAYVITIWRYKPNDGIGHVTVADSNLYYSPQANMSVVYQQNYNWNSYKTITGLDQNSIFQQPVFVDTSKSNYRLALNSPGYNLGWGADLDSIPVAALQSISPPVILSVSPSYAKRNSSVSIKGSNFGATPGMIAFGASTLSPTIWTDTLIAVTIPANALRGINNIIVRRPDNLSDTINVNIKIMQLQLIETGNTSICIGNTYPVRWTIQDYIDDNGNALDYHTRIELSRDGGATRELIAQSAIASLGVYDWLVTQPEAVNAKFYITCVEDETLADSNDVVFSISAIDTSFDTSFDTPLYRSIAVKGTSEKLIVIDMYQDPDEKKDYVANWSDAITSDTITTSKWIASPGIECNSSGLKGNLTRVWLSSGIMGNNYTITNRITTAHGRSLDMSFCLIISQN